MRAVDLLERQTSIRDTPVDRTLGVAIALTGVVMAVLVGGFFLEKAHASTQQQLLATIQGSLDLARSKQPSTHAPAPTRLQVPVVLSQEQPWHVALNSALATRAPWDELLRELEYVVPAKVHLTSVTFGSTGPASSEAGSSTGMITLGGEAKSASDLASFLSLLTRVPKISQVTLVSSSTNAGSSVITFQVTAQMALPVAPAPPTDPTITSGA